MKQLIGWMLLFALAFGCTPSQKTSGPVSEKPSAHWKESDFQTLKVYYDSLAANGKMERIRIPWQPTQTMAEGYCLNSEIVLINVPEGETGAYGAAYLYKNHFLIIYMTEKTGVSDAAPTGKEISDTTYQIFFRLPPIIRKNGTVVKDEYEQIQLREKLLNWGRHLYAPLRAEYRKKERHEKRN